MAARMAIFRERGAMALQTLEATQRDPFLADVMDLVQRAEDLAGLDYRVTARVQEMAQQVYLVPDNAQLTAHLQQRLRTLGDAEDRIIRDVLEIIYVRLDRNHEPRGRLHGLAQRWLITLANRGTMAYDLMDGQPLALQPRMDFTTPLLEEDA